MKLKEKSGLMALETQDVRDARDVGYLLKKLLTGSGTYPRERSVCQSAELKEVGDRNKSILISDMEIKLGVCSVFWSCFGPVFPSILEW